MNNPLHPLQDKLKLIRLKLKSFQDRGLSGPWKEILEEMDIIQIIFDNSIIRALSDPTSKEVIAEAIASAEEAIRLGDLSCSVLDEGDEHA